MKQRKLNVTYRDLERKDYPYIEKIIRDTWNYDSICDRPSTAKQMAKVYLRGCLAQKTYARVAVCRDRVVGIIVGQYGKDRKMNPGMHLSSFFSGLRLMMAGDGRKVAKQFRGFEKTDRDMLRACGGIFRWMWKMTVMTMPCLGGFPGKQGLMKKKSGICSVSSVP